MKTTYSLYENMLTLFYILLQNSICINTYVINTCDISTMNLSKW
jgi:hypothetical protein